MHDILLLARIQEQSVLGWMNLLHGYITSKWKILASSHMMNSSAPLQKSEGQQRLGVILQRIQGFVNSMWLGRNDMVHKNDTEDETRFKHYFTTNTTGCNGSVLHILRSQPAHRHRWLMRVRRARADLLLEQHLQPSPYYIVLPMACQTNTQK